MKNLPPEYLSDEANNTQCRLALIEPAYLFKAQLTRKLKEIIATP